MVGLLRFVLAILALPFSYAWRDDTENSVASGIAAACDVALKSGEGVFRMPLATGLSKSTHIFLVVTAGVASGQVARREIKMAMGRWRRELLPAIICVGNPRVCEQLLTDPAVPLPSVLAQLLSSDDSG